MRGVVRVTTWAWVCSPDAPCGSGVEQSPFRVRLRERAAADQMRTPKKKPTKKLRPWRAALMRSRTHYLGVVYAPNEKSAEAAAIVEFKIGKDMRRRLIVREQD